MTTRSAGKPRRPGACTIIMMNFDDFLSDLNIDSTRPSCDPLNSERPSITFDEVNLKFSAGFWYSKAGAVPSLDWEDCDHSRTKAEREAWANKLEAKLKLAGVRPKISGDQHHVSVRVRSESQLAKAVGLVKAMCAQHEDEDAEAKLTAAITAAFKVDAASRAEMAKSRDAAMNAKLKANKAVNEAFAQQLADEGKRQAK